MKKLFTILLSCFLNLTAFGQFNNDYADIALRMCDNQKYLGRITGWYSTDYTYGAACTIVAYQGQWFTFHTQEFSGLKDVTISLTPIAGPSMILGLYSDYSYSADTMVHVGSYCNISGPVGVPINYTFSGLKPSKRYHILVGAMAHLNADQLVFDIGVQSASGFSNVIVKEPVANLNTAPDIIFKCENDNSTIKFTNAFVENGNTIDTIPYNLRVTSGPVLLSQRRAMMTPYDSYIPQGHDVFGNDSAYNDTLLNIIDLANGHDSIEICLIGKNNCSGNYDTKQCKSIYIQKPDFKFDTLAHLHDGASPIVLKAVYPLFPKVRLPFPDYSRDSANIDSVRWVIEGPLKTLDTTMYIDPNNHYSTYSLHPSIFGNGTYKIKHYATGTCGEKVLAYLAKGNFEQHQDPADREDSISFQAVPAVGVQDILYKYGIKVYPNPVDKGFLNIENGEMFSGIVLYNVLGEKVLESKTSNKLDVSTLPKGFYMVRLSDAKGCITQKVLIQ